jgi:glycosyltransferase involved in cell wall biosynthesis
MSVLIVATNYTDPDIITKIQNGLHQRIDYIELARVTGGKYVDYAIVPQNALWMKLEDKGRMDLRQAFYVLKEVKNQGYTSVISLSERVGIPLTFLLPGKINQFVIQHHPLSRQKIKIEKTLHTPRKWKKIIAISRAECQSLIDQFELDNNKVVPIHCPIDTNYFKPPPSGERLPPSDHVESLGLSHRDYPTLIKALRKLPQVKCNFRVGSAWVKRDFGFSVDDLPENVSLHPFVPPDVFKQKVAESRFIIVPVKNSTQWSAGCTTVQIAQAMEKAVVATDMPGLRDYVLHKKTGLLVKPEDPDAMAEAIQYLWDHPDDALRMGQNGREHMEKGFSMEIWLEKICSVLA